MFKKFNGANDNYIKEYEDAVHMVLPKDYREFLLDTNGGCFEDELYTVGVEELKEEVGIDVLFGFNMDRSLCLNTWYDEYKYDLEEDMVIIGNSINAGLILLIWKEHVKGIFLWDHCLELEQSTPEECLYKIAGSFEEFINSLRKHCL